MNNSVTDYEGNVIGFRCFQCGEIKDRMWGTTCNSCRKENERDNEAKLLRKEVEKLRKQLEDNLKHK